MKYLYSWTRALLALIGLVVVIAGIAAGNYYADEINGLKRLSKEAPAIYLSMFKDLIRTGDAAAATVIRVPLSDSVTAEDAEEAMKSVANALNIKNVGELPLSKQIKLITGKPFRLLKIFLFCDPLTAGEMLDFSDSFSAYLPCRISMVEDKNGKIWLYTLNMDLMIHGGAPLPFELEKKALKVQKDIYQIMNSGAEGDF